MVAPHRNCPLCLTGRKAGSGGCVVCEYEAMCDAVESKRPDLAKVFRAQGHSEALRSIAEKLGVWPARQKTE